MNWLHIKTPQHLLAHFEAVQVVLFTNMTKQSSPHQRPTYNNKVTNKLNRIGRYDTQSFFIEQFRDVGVQRIPPRYGTFWSLQAEAVHPVILTVDVYIHPIVINLHGVVHAVLRVSVLSQVADQNHSFRRFVLLEGFLL